jgi:PAS domain-containing protein
MADSAPREDPPASSGSESERASAPLHVADEPGFVSVGTKLGMAVVLVVAIATAVAFAWFTARERDAVVDAKRKAADMVADLFAASLGAALDFHDEDAVKGELANLRQNRDVTSAAVWQTGRPEPLGTLGPPIATSTAGTRVLPDRVEVGRNVLGGEGKSVGLAVVHFSLEPENLAFAAARTRILWLCLLLAFGTSGVLLVITRSQVVLPIYALARAARRIERGRRGVRVQVSHKDEIGRLARAFEAMDTAISDREARLAEAHNSLRELFDHMRQAIVVFGGDGRIVGAQSREATVIFGRDRLAGLHVRDLLYPEAGPWDAELRAFDDWLALAFEMGGTHWDDIAPLAPPEVRLEHATGERVLSLEFRPIAVEGRVDRVMLLVTDETEKSHLEREMAQQGERHARQMAAMRRLVSGGGERFVSFLEGSRRRLARASEIIASASERGLDAITEVFELAHTLRGEARAYGLDDLASRAEALETLAGELRARAIAEGKPVAIDADAAGQAVAEARSSVDLAERLFVEASPSGSAVLNQVTVNRPDLTRLCDLAQDRGGDLARLADRVTARSLGDVTAALIERVPRWAESIDKRARLEIVGREVLVPERLASILSGALTHLVRNAIAHGIESKEGRENASKTPIAVMTIRGTDEPGIELLPSISVEDDGRGVQGNPFLERAAESGEPLDRSAAGLGSFRPGKIDSGSELAGRGVGLAAVVRELASVGYGVRVEARPEGGTRFRLSAHSPTSVRRAEGAS